MRRMAEEEAPDIFRGAEVEKDVERASESIIVPNTDNGVAASSSSPPPQADAHVDGEEAAVASLAPASSDAPPPSAVYANAMERGAAKLPLRTMVLIGVGIFAVVVGLTLLLFR